ncbi:hypothetical protein LRY65_00670 [Candidatus Woesebacteria bacterium]|nr:hypothetical protein [Candidatus Woesebacteria bacterium]MCD8526712.1 hypothetical protein [Candidatus Woesebacteria bacterium]MCD8546544.1 hypothetical protein [Candidatus Woesebacteria bacterium]
MSHLKKYYRQYLLDFAVDSEKIGPLVAKGKQHRVHLYGTKHVIKIPRASLYMRSYGRFTAQQVQRDIDTIRELFPEISLQTQVLCGRTHPERYVLIQEYLPHAEPVNRYTVAAVHAQLHSLMRKNIQILRTQFLFLDIFGYQGFVCSLRALLPFTRSRAQLTNLLIRNFRDGDPQLVLVDTNLSHLNHAGEFRLTHRFIDFGTILVSLILYRLFFHRPQADEKQ